MSARVEGLPALQSHLDALEGLDLTPVDAAAARLIAGRARPPRRTGTLASSLTAIGGTVTVLARYGPFVHWGARGVPARPFLTDAADQAEDAVVDLYTRHLEQLLD